MWFVLNAPFQSGISLTRAAEAHKRAESDRRPSGCLVGAV